MNARINWFVTVVFPFFPYKKVLSQFCITTVMCSYFTHRLTIMSATLFSCPVSVNGSYNLTKRLLIWTIDWFSQPLRHGRQGYTGLVGQVQQGSVQCSPT